MSNPGVQGSFARPHAAGISGGDQGWIGEGLRGDAQLRGQKRGGASGEFVRSFLPESRPQRAGPAPAVPAPTGPPPLAPGAGLGLPRAPPPPLACARTPARPPRRHSLGEYGHGCAGLSGSPTRGRSAWRSGRAPPQAVGLRVRALELLLS